MSWADAKFSATVKSTHPSGQCPPLGCLQPCGACAARVAHESMIDKPLTVVEWETLHTLCEEDAERLEKQGSKYTARMMRELTERVAARLAAARECWVML